MIVPRSPRPPRSIRLRLTVWYAATLAASLVVFAVGAFWIIQREVEDRADRLLEEATRAFGTELALEYQMLGGRAQAVDEALRGVRFRGVTLGVLGQGNEQALHLASDAVAAGADGAAAVSRGDLVASLPLLRLAPADSVEILTVPGGSVGIRVLLHRVRFADGTSAMVVAAHDRSDDRAVLRNVGLAFLALVLVTLLAAVAGGYALARRTLAPIANISRQAAAIGAADLSARVPVANPDDDLGALARVINDLLQRLQQAFSAQREFMADASHELRTPLAIVRNEANIALSLPDRPGPEYRDALRIVERESERLSALVEDLFLLARADGAGQPLRPEALYLDDLLRDVARATRSLAERRRVRLALDAVHDAEFVGDASLLRRALLNVVDNAIKHAREGGEVRLALTREAQRWAIRVADDGVGIPDEQRERLFERFYRGNAARTSQRETLTAGAGLGLPIARWIAEAHGGALVLERSGVGGSVFLLTLASVAP